MKNILIVLVIVVLLAVGAYFVFHKAPSVANNPAGGTATTTGTDTGTSTAPVDTTKTVIGTSAGGRAITAYHFGTGSAEVLFIGGIHGGYEWNTALEGYDLMDYLTAHPDAVPANERVTVIPVLNPDGLQKVVGTDGRFEAADVKGSVADSIPGRFNANNVDLNRNFDCQWKASGVWQNQTVSGGSSAFSEPESAALRDYVQKNTPVAVVEWFSAAGGVYASSCGASGILAGTNDLMKAYASASGYPAHQSFDVYETSGDSTNWLAKIGIPAISVLLTTHTDVEFDKNWKGIAAVLAAYKK